jgi:hypothetical protein
MSKKIAEWSDDIKVGIYDTEWALRLYDDKAILHMPYVKWIGNTGSLAMRVIRFSPTDSDFHEFSLIATQEIDDEEDYTEEIKEIIWNY